MLKSEYAIDSVRRYLTRHEGPVKLDTLVAAAGFLTDDGDPRWIGYAVSRLDDAGEIRHITCNPNHNHNSECAVEAIRD